MIALDATSFKTETLTKDLTWAHTCTGDDRILFAMCVEVWNVAVTYTGATYNGIPMTLIATQLDGNSQHRMALYYLKNPAAGTHNIVISCDVQSYLHGLAISYTGVDQTDPIEDFASGALLHESDFSLSVTPISDNAWAVFSAYINWPPPISAGAGTTLRITHDSGQDVIGDHGPKTPAGLITMHWTGSAEAHWGGIIAAFKPVAPPPAVGKSQGHIF